MRFYNSKRTHTNNIVTPLSFFGGYAYIYKHRQQIVISFNVTSVLCDTRVYGVDAVLINGSALGVMAR